MTQPPTRTDDEARHLLDDELDRLACRREALGEEGVHEVAGWNLRMRLEWEASALAYGRAFELNHRNVLALFGGGVCRLELGDWDGAADLFRAALELDDALEGDEGAARLDWFDEDPAFKLGNALHARGDLRDAIAAYEQSARRNATAVEALTELARCRLALGEPEEALGVLDRLERRSVRLSVRAEVNALRAEASSLM